MKLAELARQSELSQATIKYYLREGLLRPGVKQNATLAHYDADHLQRLNLISALREIVGATVADVRLLTGMIDDPSATVLDIMQLAQVLGGGVEMAGLTTPEPGAAMESRIAAICDEAGWPDVPSAARDALATVLSSMDRYGIEPRSTTIAAYSEAADLIAGSDLRNIDIDGSRDQIALMVAVGVHHFRLLLQAFVAMAQTSASIRASEPDADG